MTRFVLLLLTTASFTPAWAAITFTATLTHDQEITQGPFLTSTGGSRPLSFGNAVFTLNNAQTALSFTATIYNIDVSGLQTPLDTNDNLLAAHIHAGPAALPGGSGPPVFGFFGAPFNDVPNEVVVTPFGNDVGGVFMATWDLSEGNNTTLALQVPNLLAGRSYINFHTPQFPGGEIRGQINVPDETSTALMVAFGMLVLAAGARRVRCV